MHLRVEAGMDGGHSADAAGGTAPAPVIDGFGAIPSSGGGGVGGIGVGGTENGNGSTAGFVPSALAVDQGRPGERCCAYSRFLRSQQPL